MWTGDGKSGDGEAAPKPGEGPAASAQGQEDGEEAGLVCGEAFLPLLASVLVLLPASLAAVDFLHTQTVEAAYILAQEHLLEGLTQLKEECRVSARQQEVLIHSDMDQILESRRQLEEKVRGDADETIPESGC